MLTPRRIQDEPLTEAERARLYASQAASLRMEGFDTCAEELSALHGEIRQRQATSQSTENRIPSGRALR